MGASEIHVLVTMSYRAKPLPVSPSVQYTKPVPATIAHVGASLVKGMGACDSHPPVEIFPAINTVHTGAVGYPAKHIQVGSRLREAIAHNRYGIRCNYIPRPGCAPWTARRRRRRCTAGGRGCWRRRYSMGLASGRELGYRYSFAHR